MGRSFFAPTEDNRIEPYGTIFDHDLSDTHFEMVQRDGKYFQRRWQIGYGGKTINVEELSIDYVLGSGNHARSYLHRTPRGTLIELPLGWYAEGKPGGHWGMSPGSDSDHPRTRRFVSYQCMFCHNAIPQIPPGNEAAGSDPIFAGQLPSGIDCQRCHGPGGRHVAIVEGRSGKPSEARSSIVNPGRLSANLRMEICMQCHLETSSGRIPAEIVRFDRGPFSYRPGEPLETFRIAFDHAKGTGHDDKFEAVSSVYRLRQSKCFLQSAGKLICETCHNPHRVVRGAEATTHYAAVCHQCHPTESLASAGTHTSSQNCTGCHMPKRRAQDTPGMVMTDHLIQRRPPAGNLVAEFREPPPEPYHGEVVPYDPSPLPSTPANALYVAVAQVAMGNNVEKGLPVLASEVARQKPQSPELYSVLGETWQRSGNLTAAIAAFEQAVQLRPASTPALRSLASALEDSEQHRRAAEILQRAIQLQPADPISWHRMGLLDLAAGRLPDAIANFRRAIDLDPTLPEQSRTLGDALLRSGDSKSARAALEDALRTDPYDDAAWDLMGRVQTANELPEAFFDFERALRLRPNHAPFLHDYALALVRADRFDDAQQRAEAALKADPNLFATHELLGGLYLRKKQFAEAGREYRRMLELQPGSPRAHLRLGNLFAVQGDRSQALDHLRQAADGNDPAIARQANQAIQQLGAR